MLFGTSELRFSLWFYIIERFKKKYVKTITQTKTFILNNQESKYRICESVPESITKY